MYDKDIKKQQSDLHFQPNYFSEIIISFPFIVGCLVSKIPFDKTFLNCLDMSSKIIMQRYSLLYKVQNKNISLLKFILIDIIFQVNLGLP